MHAKSSLALDSDSPAPQLCLSDPPAVSRLTCHVLISKGLWAPARHRERRKDRILVLFTLTQKINAEHSTCGGLTGLSCCALCDGGLWGGAGSTGRVALEGIGLGTQGPGCTWEGYLTLLVVKESQTITFPSWKEKKTNSSGVGAWQRVLTSNGLQVHRAPCPDGQ